MKAVARAPARKGPLKLRLFIAGNAPNSVRAVANVRAICAKHFVARHELEIVDLMNNPERAAADGIIVTPTLLKLSPPAGRLVGSLSDTASVLEVLLSR